MNKEQLQARARVLGIGEGQVRYLSAKRLIDAIRIAEDNLRTLRIIGEAASGTNKPRRSSLE